MQTKNFDTSYVDVFDMAFVGGKGTFDEVAAHFVAAVEEYNDRNGTKLILQLEQL